MDSMPKMTLPEMSETISTTKYVDSWGPGGEMRSWMGDQPKEPSTNLERAAMLAMDVAITGEDGFGTERGVSGNDRNRLVDMMSSGLRIAIVDERENGNDGRNDVDRARLILVSTAMVAAARDRSDGLEPSELDNRVLESARRKSGIEASMFDGHDASRLAVGMTDMIVGEGAMRQVVDAVKGARTPMRDDAVEDRLRMADATWPAVKPRETEKAVSAARGSLDASVPVAAMGRGSDKGR